MGIPLKIKLSGVVFVKYIDDDATPRVGDVMLYLNDDSTTTNPGDYDDLSRSGYVKAKVFDGLVWQNIDITEFCHHRENKFSKKQRPIDSIDLCRDVMVSSSSIVIFKTYRGHFTRHEYEPGEYVRKANRGRRG